MREEIERALRTTDPSCETEIAFFGGSFTGLDRELMCRLLETADSYIRSGRVTSLRLSTRPDYIDEERLSLLARYGVRHIELGIQSMDDRVLAAAGRGHTAADSERACRLVRAYGFSLVGQMMTGLPAATPESERDTAEAICRLGAEGARIYPTMVFRGTALEEMTRAGLYTPPTLQEAVGRTAGALAVFADHGVPVLRIGLHASETLYDEDGIVFGAYHPAMGELAEGELFAAGIRRALLPMAERVRGRRVTVAVPVGALSKAIGQRGCIRSRLISEFAPAELRFREEAGLSGYRCAVEVMNGEG